ncbi:unnamed protein product [Amoebophrya sp. A25]|nr:unnamed protein product [Amoebophrya sp. A25]|eukprot:GSA25T00023886001.1
MKIPIRGHAIFERGTPNLPRIPIFNATSTTSSRPNHSTTTNGNHVPSRAISSNIVENSTVARNLCCLDGAEHHQNTNILPAGRVFSENIKYPLLGMPTSSSMKHSAGALFAAAAQPLAARRWQDGGSSSSTRPVWVPQEEDGDTSRAVERRHSAVKLESGDHSKDNKRSRRRRQQRCGGDRTSIHPPANSIFYAGMPNGFMRSRAVFCEHRGPSNYREHILSYNEQQQLSNKGPHASSNATDCKAAPAEVPPFSSASTSTGLHHDPVSWHECYLKVKNTMFLNDVAKSSQLGNNSSASPAVSCGGAPSSSTASAEDTSSATSSSSTTTSSDQGSHLRLGDENTKPARRSSAQLFNRYSQGGASSVARAVRSRNLIGETKSAPGRMTTGSGDVTSAGRQSRLLDDDASTFSEDSYLDERETIARETSNPRSTGLHLVTPPAPGGDLIRRRLSQRASRGVPSIRLVASPGYVPQHHRTYSTAAGGSRFSISMKRSHIVRENHSRFEEVYSAANKLGEGAFGTVVRAVHKMSGLARAAKKIPKLALEDTVMFENEVSILMELDHPHIVKLVEFFDQDDEYVLIFELCQGPDLFDRIVEVLDEAPRFGEVEAGRLLRHMLKAILCCHSHGIIHRDIKPENFMFSKQDPKSALQMIDLGLSEFYRAGSEHRSSTPIGTIAYMSPEMLQGEPYDRQCDIWSLGVILWALLMGEPLFTHDCDILCERQILDPRYLDKEWKKTIPLLSPEAVDLLQRMLTRDPAERLTAAEALRHPFILDSYSPDDYTELSYPPPGGMAKALASTFDTNCVQKMAEYVQMPALKRVGLFVFAHLCGTDGEDLRLYRVTFRQLDKLGSGVLLKSDLVETFQARGVEIPPDFSTAVLPFVDSHQSESLHFLEFLAATIEVQKVDKFERILQAVFIMLDSDKCGVISVDDMADLLTSNTREQLDEMLREVAPNGQMNYAEFRNMMLQSSSAGSGGR